MIVVDLSRPCLPGFTLIRDKCYKKVSASSLCNTTLSPCLKFHLTSWYVSVEKIRTEGDEFIFDFVNAGLLSLEDPMWLSPEEAKDTKYKCGQRLNDMCPWYLFNEKQLGRSICSENFQQLCRMQSSSHFETSDFVCKCPDGFGGINCVHAKGVTTFNTSKIHVLCDSGYLVVEYGYSSLKEDGGGREGLCRRSNVLPLLRAWCQGKDSCNVKEEIDSLDCSPLVQKNELQVRMACYSADHLFCNPNTVLVQTKTFRRCYKVMNVRANREEAEETCYLLGGEVIKFSEMQSPSVFGNLSGSFISNRVWISDGSECSIALVTDENATLCHDCVTCINAIEVVCSLPPKVLRNTFGVPPVLLDVPDESLRTTLNKDSSANRQSVPTKCTSSNKTVVPVPFPTPFPTFSNVFKECQVHHFQEQSLVLCILKRTEITIMNKALNVSDMSLEQMVDFLADVIDFLINSTNPYQVRQTMNISFNIFNEMLAPEWTEDWLEERKGLAKFFNLIDRLGLKTASFIHNDSVTYLGDNLEIQLIKTEVNHDHSLQLFLDDESSVVISNISTSVVRGLLQRYRTLSTRGPDDKSDVRTRFSPVDIVGLTLQTDALPVDVLITFEMKNLSATSISDVTCLFYNVSTVDGAFLDTSGCTFVGANETHIICHCNHLTNFAVLTNWKGLDIVDNKMLQILTWIGCVASIFCLVACLVVFSLTNSLNPIRNAIHKNLCFCLLVANVTLLAGLKQTSLSFSAEKTTCLIIAAALHWLYLCAFAWMASEGYFVLRLVVVVFEARSRRVWPYYLLSYGIPSLVVSMAIIVSYATEETYVYPEGTVCWINTHNHMIWTFLGPVIGVVVANLVVLIVVLKKSHSIKTKADAKGADKVKKMAWGVAVLAPVFGITWLFGLFFTDTSLIGFAYIFTVLNSLQGVFIFAFHFVFNDKVRENVVRSVQRRKLGRAKDGRDLSFKTSIRTTSSDTSR